MNITCLTVGLLETNCYLVRDAATGEGALIDPGAEAPRIVEACAQESLEPGLIVNTHGHADHVGADAELKRRYPSARLCIGRGEAELLGEPVRNLSAMLGLEGAGVEPDALLDEGQELRFGQCVLRVMQTPGHTPGSICLLAPDERPQVVFCGDLIFQGGVGRVDLPGGDAAALRRSIEHRILKLPGETVLLPGHGPPTTVQEAQLFWAALDS